MIAFAFACAELQGHDDWGHCFHKHQSRLGACWSERFRNGLAMPVCAGHFVRRTRLVSDSRSLAVTLTYSHTPAAYMYE